MEAVMEQMKLKNIDKSDWKRYRFDEIAKNVSERVDPNKTDLTTYIGLEHIDSENIHITRSGTPDDVNGTKLRFYKGDIIFGRRRAYQRKAGVAECDGFCSAHALVLRANPDVIHPKLFPFFMHSDAFMDCAVNISVGSLSPTINWGTLKSQEFLLPPPEEQEKLAELLWAMDEVIKREKIVLIKTLNTKEAFQNKYFNLQNANSTVKLGTIADLSAGGTPSTSKLEYWENGTVPWLSSGEVYKIVKSTEKKISDLGLKNSSAKLLPKNTCLIALAGQGKTKGTVAITDIELCTNQSVASIITKPEKVEPYYLFYNLDSRYSDFRHITGKENSRTGLNLKILRDFEIAFHGKSQRNNISKEFSLIYDSIDIIEDKIQYTRALQKSIINQIF